MQCPECRADIPDDAVFCGYCGHGIGAGIDRPGNATGEADPVDESIVPAQPSQSTAPDRHPPEPAADETRRVPARSAEIPATRPATVPAPAEVPKDSGRHSEKRSRWVVVGVATGAIAVVGFIVIALGSGGAEDDSAEGDTSAPTTTSVTTTAPTQAPTVATTSATTTTTTTTTSAPIVGADPIGVQVNVLNEGLAGACNDDPDHLECGAYTGAPAGEPFHIVHGFLREPTQTIADVEALGTYFELYLNGVQLVPDALLDYAPETGDLAASYLFQFSNGLNGEQSFVGIWYEFGEVVVYIDLLIDFN